MQKAKLTIGSDLDDIVAPFGEVYIDWTNRKYKTNYQFGNLITYGLKGMAECMGLSQEESKRRMAEFCDAELFNIEPYEDAIEGINHLAKEGHDLYLITSRRDSLQEQTEKWVNKYFSGKFSGICVTNGMGETGPKISKEYMISEFGIEFFVEDNFDTCEAIAKSGCPVMMLERPWNVHRKINPTYKDKIFKADSWSDVLMKANEFSLEKFKHLTHQ